MFFTADTSEISEYEAPYEWVVPGIGFSLSFKLPRFTDEEINYLYLGIKLLSKDILAARNGKSVVIVVKNIMFDLVEYQPEGLACAIMGWAGEYFNIPTPEIPVQLIREERRFVFQFPDDEQM